MDATGLFFRDTSRKTFHLKEMTVQVVKLSKERVTLALCASLSGENLIPLLLKQERLDDKSNLRRLPKDLKQKNESK